MLLAIERLAGIMYAGVVYRYARDPVTVLERVRSPSFAHSKK
jgi:hypothetical protein